MLKKGQVFNYLLQGHNIDKLEESKNEFYMDNQKKYYSLLSISILSKSKEEYEEKENLFLFALDELIKKIINKKQIEIIFSNTKHIDLLFFDDDYNKCLNDTKELSELLIKQILEKLKFDIAVIYSNPRYNLNTVSENYKKIISFLDIGYFINNINIYNLDNYLDSSIKIEETFVYQKLIIESIFNRKTNVMQYLEKLIEIIPEVSLWKKENAINNMASIIIFIKNNIEEKGIKLDLFSSEKELYDVLASFSLWNEIKEYLYNFMNTILNEIFLNIENNRNLSDILKVKDYIYENYNTGITLEDVAKIACMNPYYFSSFFKKSTGENFKKFLLKVQMENAIKLLLTTDSKVYEIAGLTGFNDTRHFSDMFRKFYGINPMEYRKSFKNKL